MKWVVMIFFLPILASAQVSQVVSRPEFVRQTTASFLSTDDSQVNTAAFEKYLDDLQDKRTSFKNDEDFVRYVFTSAHRKFLRNFREYSSFGQLLKNGSYNCLTATSLYALILEKSEIRYEIIETNYHIFLMAHTSQGDVLIESTDPVGGFVSDPSEIRNKVASYKKNTVTTSVATNDYYQIDCNLYNSVRLEEMAGLLHYNLAIASFNDRDIEAAISHLDQATTIYSSPRMEAMTRLVLLSVVESKMNMEEKTSMIKKIQAFRKRNLMAMASASR